MSCGSLQPASWPEAVYPEAVTGFTVPQSQHLPGGLASTWGVGDVKALLPSMNAKRMCWFIIAQLGAHFQSQKVIKRENHLCIS